MFRIHWVMASLVFLKSLSLLFHGINYNKIATNGQHMETWAILYYITHLLKVSAVFVFIFLYFFFRYPASTYHRISAAIWK
jgi:hypothetical protein